MLVATVLAAVLMSAVLAMTAAVSQDRRKVTALNAAAPANGAMDLIAWDLSNAQSLAAGSDGQSIVLVGSNGIDPATINPNGRLVQVTYRVATNGGRRDLWRVQKSLDDPAQPTEWSELVAGNVTEFLINPSAAVAAAVPSRVRVQLAATGFNVDRTLWIK